jgi:hypothetical protein
MFKCTFSASITFLKSRKQLKKIKTTLRSTVCESQPSTAKCTSVFFVLGCDSDTFCMQMRGKSIRYFLERINELKEKSKCVIGLIKFKFF